MADDLWYNPGDNYLLDDISGLKIRASRARMIPGGQTGKLMVSPSRWEPQQPQDFVQGVRDEQVVAIARPRQQNQFVLVGGQVTAFATRGSEFSCWTASSASWWAASASCARQRQHLPLCHLQRLRHDAVLRWTAAAVRRWWFLRGPARECSDSTGPDCGRALLLQLRRARCYCKQARDRCYWRVIVPNVWLDHH